MLGDPLPATEALFGILGTAYGLGMAGLGAYLGWRWLLQRGN